MSLNTDKKLYLTLGIVVLLTLILSTFTIGLLYSSKDEKITNNQVLILGNTNQKQGNTQVKEELPVLGQTYKEQQKQHYSFQPHYSLIQNHILILMLNGVKHTNIK